jgi:hypothetical protein
MSDSIPKVSIVMGGSGGTGRTRIIQGRERSNDRGLGR